MKYFISIFLVLLTLIFATGFGYVVYKDNQYIPASDKDIANFASNIRFSTAF